MFEGTVIWVGVSVVLSCYLLYDRFHNFKTRRTNREQTEEILRDLLGVETIEGKGRKSATRKRERLERRMSRDEHSKDSSPGDKEPQAEPLVPPFTSQQAEEDSGDELLKLASVRHLVQAAGNKELKKKNKKKKRTTRKSLGESAGGPGLSPVLEAATTRAATYAEVLQVLQNATLDRADVENVMSFLSHGGTGVWEAKGKEDPLVLKIKVKELTATLAETRAECEAVKELNRKMEMELTSLKQRVQDFKVAVGKQMDAQNQQILELRRGKEAHKLQLLSVGA